MKVIESILDFCHEGWGEDRLFVHENRAGVVDGATPVQSQKYKNFQSQAEWLVETFRCYIKSQPNTFSYPMCCRAFINQVQDSLLNDFDEEYQLPCFTTASICVNNGFLLGSILGDCGISILLNSGKILSYTDNRVDAFSAKTIAQMQQALRDGHDVQKAISKQKIINRESMNMSGGYWTVGFRGEFEKEFVSFSVEKETVRRVLIYTDGFMRAFQLCNISPQSILSEKYSLNYCLEHLRKTECEQANISNNKLIKIHDDVAAICLEL